MIDRPEYIEKIRPFIGKGVVKVLTGIRRSGKTVLLQLVQQELRSQGILQSRMLSFNFESALDPLMHDRDEVYRTIQKTARTAHGMLYLFLDEVQELEGWERIVNSCMIDFDIDIYLTGSNTKLLSGELATYLGGRYVEIKVYPFSFKEALRAGLDGREIDRGRDAETPISEAITSITQLPKEAFLSYLRRGGMPFLYDTKLVEPAVRQYLSDVFDSIILKDIAQRHQVRDIEQLRRVIYYLVANIGTTFSASSVSRFMKNKHRSIAPETLYNDIEYCKEACLLHLVPREDLQGKRLLSFQEKIYIADHGLREALFGTNQRDIQQTLENIVYMELLRCGWDVRIGKIRDTEVDFVAERSGEREYIQVAYLLATEETIQREFSALDVIPDHYPKFVLSLDDIDLSRNGIRHKNLISWLLRQDEYDISTE